MIDTRREVRQAKSRTSSWFAWALLAVVGAVVVAINKRPPPSPQDVLRRAFDEEKAKQERAAETLNSQNAVTQCIDYVRKASPDYNSTFDAYYDPTTGYHWTRFAVDWGSAEFQWKKCMSALGRSMD